jgi:dTDP-4-dehydrorhamnose reductase
MKKLLITGVSGFLGWNLANWLAKQATQDWQVYGTYRNHGIALARGTAIKLDLTDRFSLMSLFEDLKPDAVVHAAAQSQPNACQSDPEAAYKINVTASIYLAQHCAKASIPCVFTSTDLVFDGLHPPYKECDPVSPINRYGEQKVAAERAMQERYPKVTIARMPLMFGVPSPASGSFIQPFLEKLRSQIPLNLFTDEYRTPVSAIAAAQGLLLALTQGRGEILHLGGKERISRYEFGHLMSQVWDINPSLIQSSLQKDVPMAAPRPADVSLDSQKAYGLGYDPPSLRQALTDLKGKI